MREAGVRSRGMQGGACAAMSRGPTSLARLHQCALVATLCMSVSTAYAVEPGLARPIPVAPSPRQTASASPALLQQPDVLASGGDSNNSSVWQSPWFWAGVAGVIVAGVVLTLALSSDEEPDVPAGTLSKSVNVLTREPCGTASERR
jgi:hypothetical protein